MSKIFHPHDKTFRSVMKDINVAKEFLGHYLPENIRPLVDLNTLLPLDNTYVDSALQKLQSDMLYQVNIKGKPGFIYILIDHQSQAEHLMPFRLWQYIIKFWNDYIKQQKTEPKRLPLIIPMVFYNGAKPYDKPQSLCDIIEGEKETVQKLLFEKFHLIDTNTIEDDTLRQQVWSGIVTFAFKHARARDFKKAILEFLEFAKQLYLGEGDRSSELIKTLLCYQLSVGKIYNRQEVLDIIQEKLITSIGGEDIMSTVADYLRQEGLEIGLIRGKKEGHYKGREEGRQEGLQQGECALLLKLVQRKFGIIPVKYRHKIETADADILLIWGERLLEVERLEEIFEDKIIA